MTSMHFTRRSCVALRAFAVFVLLAEGTFARVVALYRGEDQLELIASKMAFALIAVPLALMCMAVLMAMQIRQTTLPGPVLRKLCRHVFVIAACQACVLLGACISAWALFVVWAHVLLFAGMLGALTTALYVQMVTLKVFSIRFLLAYPLRAPVAATRYLPMAGP
ncbi:hypothetical protein T492DRAFT_1089387 [Pavlovales sp. CCMP2436]|nr:hypothetical protein T492DRAFT_1089387 [Pavlovales sp. CCMP2436]